MRRISTWCSVLLMALSLGIGGCGGSAAQRGAASPSASVAEAPRAPGAPAGASHADYAGEAAADEAGPGGAPATQAAPAPAATGTGSYGAPGAAKAAPSMSDSSVGSARGAEARAVEPQPASRPGLGTAWGETHASHTTTAPFVRDDNERPFAVSSLWYNDREGANAMARASDYRTYERGVAQVLGGALTVSVRDDSARILPGFFAGGRQYVIGQAGQRYVVIVQNNTNYRYEVVASVDGLDVIDGTAAAFTKRGYLLQPYGTLEIEGFRRSADAVAAFRFSSVRGSYASRSGQGDRNVGVIGVALFNEKGTNPRWTQEEIDKRHSADPFPGQYATPPRN
jgi:hypothetical protein